MSSLLGGFNPLAGFNLQTLSILCGLLGRAPSAIPPILNVPVVQKQTAIQCVPIQRIAQALVPVPVTEEVLVRVPVQRIQQVPVQVPIQSIQAVPVRVPVCVNVSFAPVAATPFACPPGVAALDP